jgi:hypothetical protein
VFVSHKSKIFEFESKKKMEENDAFCYPYHIEDDCIPLEKWSNVLQHSENSVSTLILLCHFLFLNITHKLLKILFIF